jgi:hypothetical protein
MAKKKEVQQKFRVLKLWKTAKKTFKAGELYETNNEKIIKFLTTNKIVEKWD